MHLSIHCNGAIAELGQPTSGSIGCNVLSQSTTASPHNIQIINWLIFRACIILLFFGVCVFIRLDYLRSLWVPCKTDSLSGILAYTSAKNKKKKTFFSRGFSMVLSKANTENFGRITFAFPCTHKRTPLAKQCILSRNLVKPRLHILHYLSLVVFLIIIKEFW